MARLTERSFCGDNSSDVEILFVMESPGEQELVCNYACVGPTGNVMAKYLCGKNMVSLGCLLKNKKESRFAIFETFDFPLCESLQNNLNTSFEKAMLELKKIDNDYADSSRREHYDKLKIFWENSTDSFLYKKREFINLYKNELINFANSFSNLKNIVICGYIAQSCFMQAFCPHGYNSDFDFPPYGFLFNVNTSNNPRIYFSNHPSVEFYPDKFWKYGCDFKNGKKRIWPPLEAYVAAKYNR